MSQISTLKHSTLIVIKIWITKKLKGQKSRIDSLFQYASKSLIRFLLFNPPIKHSCYPLVFGPLLASSNPSTMNTSIS